MRRVLSTALGATGLLALGLVLVLLWADSAVVPPSELERRRTLAATSASMTRDTFTVMTYNLDRFSAGPGETEASARLEQALRPIRTVNPDFLALQEVNLGRARFGPAFPLDSIAAQVGYTSVAQAVRRNDRFLPFPLSNPGPSVSGQALLSRYPVRRTVRRVLPDTAGASWAWPFFRSDPIVQVTAVGVGGWPLIVMNVNIDAPDADAREQQARAVNGLYRRVAQQGFPAILVGTVHGTMPSAAAYSPAGEQTMEILIQGTDLMPALSPESAQLTGRSVATYPADNPTRKVDYIFYRPRLVLPIEAKTWCADAPPVSDHCPVSLSFFLPRPLDRLSKGPLPDEQVPSLDSLLVL